MSRLLFSLGLLSVGGAGCSGDSLGPSDPAAMTVRFVNVEGGCWVLEPRQGPRYEPIGLPAQFKQDGLRVLVTLKPRPDVGSFCMVGELVEVVTISAQ